MGYMYAAIFDVMPVGSSIDTTESTLRSTSSVTVVDSIVSACCKLVWSIFPDFLRTFIAALYFSSAPFDYV